MSVAASADRRSFLGSSLVLASTVAASTAALASPAILADDPDAELVAMEAAITSILRRQQQADREAEEAFDRLVPPPIPAALIWRPADRWPICATPDRLAGYDIAGRRERVFDGGVRDLSRLAQDYAAQGESYDNAVFGRASRARTREIIAAHEAWQAAVGQAEAEVGLTAAYDAGAREQQLIHDLRLRIASTPARTTTGLFVKARVAVGPLSGSNLQWPEREFLPEQLAAWAREPMRADQHGILTLSLMVDVLRLDRTKRSAA